MQFLYVTGMSIMSIFAAMKDEIIIPVLKVEDFVAANKRRDSYALTRDLQATEFNGAIAARMLAETRKKTKCGKCGKEFEAPKVQDELVNCPECK
jgi:Zn finger protein HypA/HybF involved in hydrogenase expression